MINDFECLVDINPFEKRIALVQSGKLKEFYVEYADAPSYVGNIYKGTIARIMPGLQAAFVDIGLERTAYMKLPGGGDNDVSNSLLDTSLSSGSASNRRTLYSQGQVLAVQVIKNPLGGKGATVSPIFKLASVNMIIHKGGNKFEISKKIPLDNHGHLSKLKTACLDSRDSWMIRTNAINVPIDVLLKQQGELQSQMNMINSSLSDAVSGECVYYAPGMEVTILSNYLNYPISKVVVHDWNDEVCHSVNVSDSEPLNVSGAKSKSPYLISGSLYNEIVKYISSQEINVVIEKYNDGETFLFEKYNIESQLKKARHRKVYLKSGGEIFIDHTEAMTVVDVNTAGCSGKKSSEETMLKTNIEAVDTLCEQIRLRNIGGIVIVDFIDMKKSASNKQLVNYLRKKTKEDTVKTTVSDISSLGIVQMTRQRLSPSLLSATATNCYKCHGSGVVPNMRSIVSCLHRGIKSKSAKFPCNVIELQAGVSLYSYLMGDKSGIRECFNNLSKIVLTENKDLAADQFCLIVIDNND